MLTKDSKAKEEGRGPGEPEVIYRRLGSSRGHVMVSRDKARGMTMTVTLVNQYFLKLPEQE